MLHVRWLASPIPLSISWLASPIPLSADGEDVAREHMGAYAAPQLPKETSEKAGASTTAGGACECNPSGGLEQES